jgi:hypothetical protein
MSQRKENQGTREASKSGKKNGAGVKIFAILFLLIGLLVAGLLLFSKHEKSQPAQARDANLDPLPGIQTGDAPWGAELIHLRERLLRIGLPALQEEGSALHIHQHLSLFIHGKEVAVPPGVGFNPIERFISPIHTHDGSGVIHIESPTIQKFTLGEFFDVWGVRLQLKCVGAYCEDQKNAIRVFINGVPWERESRAIELADHQVIVMTYGEKSELPNPIPSQYPFPPGT